MMEEDDEAGDVRLVPSSNLDLDLLLTNSVWGKNEVSQDLKDKLSKVTLSKDENGKIVSNKKELWGILSFFTRDMRLANLSEKNGELLLCRYHIDLAGDLLDSDMIEPFIICLSRAACILETSQSKGGFLRIKGNTMRHEQINELREPPKKGFFGGGNKDRGY